MAFELVVCKRKQTAYHRQPQSMNDISSPMCGSVLQLNGYSTMAATCAPMKHDSLQHSWCTNPITLNDHMTPFYFQEREHHFLYALKASWFENSMESYDEGNVIHCSYTAAYLCWTAPVYWRWRIKSWATLNPNIPRIHDDTSFRDYVTSFFPKIKEAPFSLKIGGFFLQKDGIIRSLKDSLRNISQVTVMECLQYIGSNVYSPELPPIYLSLSCVQYSKQTKHRACWLCIQSTSQSSVVCHLFSYMF